MQADFFYADGIGELHTITLAVLPFTVMATQAAPTPAPAGNLLGFILLTLMIGGLAVWSLRFRGAAPLLVVLIGVTSGVRAADRPNVPPQPS